MIIKKIAIAVATGLIAFSFVGCGAQGGSPDSEGTDTSGTEYVQVSTPSGPVGCVVFNSSNYVGGIDCDWNSK